MKQTTASDVIGTVVISSIAVIITLAFTGFMMALNGIVIYFMWKWFMTPLGVMPITAGHAVGIQMLVCMLRPSILANFKKSVLDEGMRSLASNIIFPLTTLGLGYIVHRFFMLV